MMRTVFVAGIAAVICFAAWHAPALADGGTVRVVEQHEGIQISVFTAPDPFRAGPVDVSVLVQDPKTGAPPAGCETTVTFTPAAGGMPIQVPATTEAATNKLLQSARFELPSAGPWQVRVTSNAAGKDIETEFAVTAGPALPRWLAEWPWFTWPVVAVMAFVVHGLLVARVQRAS